MPDRHRGRRAGGLDPFRAILLEDAIFMAESGESDAAIMARQGYTNRESWLRSLTRAGLPKVGKQHNTEASIRERLVGYVFVPAPVKHGTASGYKQCRPSCDACRSWNAKRGKRNRVDRQRRPMPEHVPHGTDYAYRGYGCRCEPCVLANRAVQRARYAARKAKRDA